MKQMKQYTVVDLFSGAGGMSFGFHVHPAFRIVGAADAQLGKPSSGHGALDCNETYYENMRVQPVEVDLGLVNPLELKRSIYGTKAKRNTDILIACAPCTGFSRTNSKNHLDDDPRNSLVQKTAEYVREFQPKIFLMENARELIQGNFSMHYSRLCHSLEKMGYITSGEIHMLNSFGLPQVRERAFLIAVQHGMILKNLSNLWEGYVVDQTAVTVRRAIGGLPKLAAGEADSKDRYHTSPRFGNPTSLDRVQAVPHDGGSWSDLRFHPDADRLLTPAMKRYIQKGKFGSHPDVYGRLWWDRPCITIKRECAHVGNGRYSHPEQDRLCSVREMALMQGFPSDYSFNSTSMANMYRHIGDAVPPLISYQIAALCEWIFTGTKPDIKDCILPGSTLRIRDIQIKSAHSSQLELDLAGAK